MRREDVVSSSPIVRIHVFEESEHLALSPLFLELPLRNPKRIVRLYVFQIFAKQILHVFLSEACQEGAHTHTLCVSFQRPPPSMCRDRLTMLVVNAMRSCKFLSFRVVAAEWRRVWIVLRQKVRNDQRPAWPERGREGLRDLVEVMEVVAVNFTSASSRIRGSEPKRRTMNGCTVAAWPKSADT